jgi:hypothetical protein
VDCEWTEWSVIRITPDDSRIAIRRIPLTESQNTVSIQWNGCYWMLKIILDFGVRRRTFMKNVTKKELLDNWSYTWFLWDVIIDHFVINIIIIDIRYIVTWIYDIKNLGLQNAANQFTYRFIPEITNLQNNYISWCLGLWL